jgi:Asp-tRNA(Asn)/Glu-tRNA(Gln) amidotransferase A subunit family amidase
MTQTNWDLIRDAAGSTPTSQASLEEVARRSWPAIYAFIRASGRSPDDATELTQGFICDVFLSRHLLEKADQSRGRFRTLVMGSVRNYLADIFTLPASLAGLPGLSMPAGFGAGGRPVGLQLIGRVFDEARLLAVADRFQQATDWHARRPAGAA